MTQESSQECWMSVVGDLWRCGVRGSLQSNASEVRIGFPAHDVC